MPIASPARWRCCSATRLSAPGGHRPGRRSPPRAQVRSTPCWTASRRGSMRSPRWHLRKCRRRHCAPAPMRAPEFWHGRSGPMAGLAAGLLASIAAPIATAGVAIHIVTRGYGGFLGGPVPVDPARHDAKAVGDEALLLAASSPCWVARDRAAGVREAVVAGAGAILLDDGFQNPAIEKDLSLVVVDAEYGFGNGRVIPAGPLREPVAAGLARADAIVLLGDGVAPDAARGAGCPIFRASLEPVDGARFAGVPVVAFAGIGRPEKFFASLRRVGAKLIAAYPFADHHRFGDAEINRLRDEHADVRLVTTAKDWVRLPPRLRGGIEVLEVEIRWHDEAAVAHLVGNVLPKPSAGHEIVRSP